ncbi:MAG: DNA cytosine methyltransferase [Clostridia bacterium]
MEKKEIKWAAHIPLIGGFGVAGLQEFETAPIFVSSYSAFAGNDGLFHNYMENTKGLKYDKFLLDVEDIPEKYCNGYIDIMLGVPPCAGLSMCAAIKQDQRDCAAVNDWMLNSAQYILEKVKPKVYCFENAPGLSSNLGVKVREKIENIASTFEYSVVYYKTNTSKHGIPQKRSRTYCFLVNTKTAPILEFKDKEMCEYVKYLDLVPKDATLQDVFYCNDIYADTFEPVQYVKELYGDKWRESLLEGRDSVSLYNVLLERNKLEDLLAWCEAKEDCDPAVIKNIKFILFKKSKGLGYRLGYKVVKLDRYAAGTMYSESLQRTLHPKYDRRLNAREIMHLMGMPHDFQILDYKKDVVKITQNCPVNTNRAMIEECIAIIKNERPFYTEKVLFINNEKGEIIQFNQDKKSKKAKTIALI